MSTILIKNPLCCSQMNPDQSAGDKLRVFSGGHIFIKDNKIISAGPENFDGKADTEIDAARMVVMPGLVNTHHHFFQTLTRNLFSIQKAGLFDWLTTNYEIWRVISSEGFYISAKLAIAELLKSGCTTTSDHLYLFPESAGPHLIDTTIKAAGELEIRFQPTRGSMSLGRSKGGLPPENVIQNEETILQDSERLIKKYHDDSFGAMTRISLAPCSPFSVTGELMQKTVKIAKKYNLQIHTHLAETKDEEKFCIKKVGMRPFEYMKSLGWVRENAWFAHTVFLNDEEIREAGDAGIGISHCPSSNMRLGSGIARIGELLSAGVKVSFGVDGSASNDSSNLLNELRTGMLLSRLREEDKWLSTDDVLWMGTKGGSAVLGRDDIGQIAPGKCADIIMISLDEIEYSGAQHDPMAALVFSTAMKPVDWVIVNGKIIVKNGKILGLNEKELICKHQEISDKLIEVGAQKTGKRLTRF